MVNRINWKTNRPFKILANLNIYVLILMLSGIQSVPISKKEVNPTIDGIIKLVKDIVSVSPNCKRKWISSPEAINTQAFFIKLCKISPEIFGNLFSSRGKLLSTRVTTIWAGTHQTFSTRVKFKVVLQLPNKENLWHQNNQSISKRKSLTFVEESISISTNVGLFLTGGKTRPDKKKKNIKNS